MYEMPHDALDIVLSKKFGKQVEVKLNAKDVIGQDAVFKQFPNHTFLFEVTDPSDVHIIAEDFGETLIGVIDVTTGEPFSEARLDEISEVFGLKRPSTLENMRFGELKALLKTVKHEGFMVFDSDTKQLLFKLKSPYYLVSKFFGRSQDKSLGAKLNKQHVDEEYYPLVDYIKAHKDTFNQLDKLQKIAFVQDFLEQLE